MYRACIVLSLASLAFAQTARKTPSALSALSQSFQELADRVSPAVVQIRTVGIGATAEGGDIRLRTSRGVGSGVIVDTAGYIVTNAHVIGASRRVQVQLTGTRQENERSRSILKPPGKLLLAEIVGIDRETDLAVLKVPQTGLPALSFGDSESLRKGNVVFTVGSPLGLDNSVAMGVISSTARQIRPDDPMIYVQTDASINPGNSGGPLVDTEGSVVGINTFILTQSGGSEGVGFAVPSNIVRSVYDQIRKNGRVRRGQVGLVLQTLTPSLANALKLGRETGVLVGDVTPDGSAEAAGIEVKDIILTLNGKPMENARQFGVDIYGKTGETVEVGILRGDQTITKQVAVLERPRDTDRILSMVTSDRNIIEKLGILGLDLDEKVTPLMPGLRKISGVVVAGVLREAPDGENTLSSADVIYSVNNVPVKSVEELKKVLSTVDSRSAIALQIERSGQLQYLTVDLD